jgi:hypothetical protein
MGEPSNVFIRLTQESIHESRTGEDPEWGCIAVAIVYAKGDAHAAEDVETYVPKGRANLQEG